MPLSGLRRSAVGCIAGFKGSCGPAAWRHGVGEESHGWWCFNQILHVPDHVYSLLHIQINHKRRQNMYRNIDADMT